jgi:nucleotide-binding universal stress UspA family protein
MENFRNILVAIDFSTYSVQAVEDAKTIARKFKSAIYLAHVIDAVPALAAKNPESSYESVSHHARNIAMISLENYAAQYFSSKDNVKLVVREGAAEEELLMLAQDEKIDLIVMATHARTGLARLIAGSVTEKVIQKSPVPVLVVKSCPEPPGSTPQEY